MAHLRARSQTLYHRSGRAAWGRMSSPSSTRSSCARHRGAANRRRVGDAEPPDRTHELADGDDRRARRRPDRRAPDSATRPATRPSSARSLDELDPVVVRIADEANPRPTLASPGRAVARAGCRAPTRAVRASRRDRRHRSRYGRTPCRARTSARRGCRSARGRCPGRRWRRSSSSPRARRSRTMSMSRVKRKPRAS